MLFDITGTTRLGELRVLRARRHPRGRLRVLLNRMAKSLSLSFSVYSSRITGWLATAAPTHSTIRQPFKQRQRRGDLALRCAKVQQHIPPSVEVVRSPRQTEHRHRLSEREGSL
jgi:hypothetical protein